MEFTAVHEPGSRELGVNRGSHEPINEPDLSKFMNLGSHGS